MIDTGFDPDLDPASLRQEADLFARYAAHKRQFADLIELSCFTTMLNATDGDGRRGVDRLLALDPIAGRAVLRQVYACFAAGRRVNRTAARRGERSSSGRSGRGRYCHSRPSHRSRAVHRSPFGACRDRRCRPAFR